MNVQQFTKRMYYLMHSLNITIENLEVTLKKFGKEHGDDFYIQNPIGELIKEMRFSSHLLSNHINNLDNEEKIN